MFVTPPVFKERKNQENQSANSIWTAGFSFFSISRIFVKSINNLESQWSCHRCHPLQGISELSVRILTWSQPVKMSQWQKASGWKGASRSTSDLEFKCQIPFLMWSSGSPTSPRCNGKYISDIYKIQYISSSRLVPLLRWLCPYSCISWSSSRTNLRSSAPSSPSSSLPSSA